jgi:site-specific DNA-adenine methylase
MINDSFNALMNDVSQLQRDYKALQHRLERAESIPYKIRQMIEKDTPKEELLAYLITITPHGANNAIS